MRLTPIGVLLLLVAQPIFAQSPVRPREIVQATVRISNPKSTATGFILSLPKTSEEQPEQSVLVTSAHVLERADGEEVTVHFRRAAAEGDYVRVPAPLKIRAGGKPLWEKHPKQDVAVIKVDPPQSIELPRISLDVLATDADLKSAEPGDLARCVVFPHGAIFDPSPASFPIIRLGCIASYPLLPLDKQRTILVDYNTFEGDSGGPVFWLGSGEAGGPPAVKILGLVKGQHWINQRYELTYESGEIRKQLGLALLEHALTISETISQLKKD